MACLTRLRCSCQEVPQWARAYSEVLDRCPDRCQSAGSVPGLDQLITTCEASVTTEVGPSPQPPFENSGQLTANIDVTEQALHSLSQVQAKVAVTGAGSVRAQNETSQVASPALEALSIPADAVTGA